MAKKKSSLGFLIFIGIIAFFGLTGGGAVVVKALHHQAVKAVTVVSGSENSFIRAILADMRAPATTANISSLAAWFPHEFPSYPPPAENNPMATKMSEPGASDYLSNGVKNYPTASEGAQATAATLTDGYYPAMVAKLRAGEGLCGSSLAGEFLTWSGNGYSSVC